MAGRLNANEKHLVKVLLSLTGLIGVATTIGTQFIANPAMQPYAALIIIGVSLVILYFGQDYVFGKLLARVVPATKAKRGITDGQWQIRIAYQDDGEEVVRTGYLTFKNSMVGVKIFGSKLIDNKTKKTEKIGWQADDAELIEYGNTKVIIYLYKIPRQDKPSEFEKAGIVVACQSSDDEEQYVGYFKDISIVDEKIQREGEVRLYK